MKVRALLNSFKLLFVIISILTLSACQAWLYHDKEVTKASQAGKFTVNVPAGWVQNTLVKDGIFLTKDGPDIQYIHASYENKDKAFKDSGFNWREGLLPTELAEGVVSKIKKEPNQETAEVISINPVKLSGRDAFDLTMKTYNAEGVEYKRRVIGFATSGGVYLVTYKHLLVTFSKSQLPNSKA